jgi:hypothetical protein
VIICHISNKTKDPDYFKSEPLANAIYELGCKDSNLGMPGPKPGALPLGDTPSISQLNKYSTGQRPAVKKKFLTGFS